MESSATLSILALWALFLGTHMGLSSLTLRPKLVALLGARGFLAGYSVVALATFIPLVRVYGENKHMGAYFWYGSQVGAARPLMYLGMVLALTLCVGAFMNPSPSSIAPGGGEIRGVLRVSRHPLFMGVALIGLLHLAVARVHATDLAFFLGLPIVSLIGCWHQDRRHLATGGERFATFYASTSFLPFARGGFAGFREAPLALVAGIILTVGLRIAHPSIFGGAS